MGLWIVEKPKQKTLNVFFFLGLFFMLLPTISVFWSIFREILKFLQLPERVLIAAVILLIFAFAIWMKELALKIPWQKAVMAILLITNIYCAREYFDTRVDYLQDYGDRKLCEEIAGLGAGEEYLPVQTTRDYLVEPLIAYDDQGNRIEGIRKDGNYIFKVDTESLYYDIPFVWYKGYAATNLSEQVELEVGQVPKTGLVRVFTENKIHSGDEIVVYYRGTIIQKVSYVITVIGVLLCAGYGGFYALRKKR